MNRWTPSKTKPDPRRRSRRKNEIDGMVSTIAGGPRSVRQKTEATAKDLERQQQLRWTPTFDEGRQQRLAARDPRDFVTLVGLDVLEPLDRGQLVDEIAESCRIEGRPDCRTVFTIEVSFQTSPAAVELLTDAMVLFSICLA